MHANPNRCTLLDEPAETAHSRAVPCRAMPCQAMPSRHARAASQGCDGWERSSERPSRAKTFLSPSSGRYAKCGMTCAAQRIHPTVPARRKLA